MDYNQIININHGSIVLKLMILLIIGLPRESDVCYVNSTIKNIYIDNGNGIGNNTYQLYQYAEYLGNFFYVCNYFKNLCFSKIKVNFSSYFEVGLAIYQSIETVVEKYLRYHIITNTFG